jgi:hypothetical protein
MQLPGHLLTLFYHRAKLDTGKAKVGDGTTAWTSLPYRFGGVSDHTLLTNIGTNTHAQIDSHIASTSNPHSVTKAQVGLSNVPNVDATLRANHTGTQLSTTISDFTEASQDAVGAMVDASLVYVDATPLLSRAALTGDVTASSGSNATTIANNAVTNVKAADMPANTIKGNNTGSTADPIDLTVAQTRTLLAINNVDNTSDANKPISTATQTALNGKANTTHTHVLADITQSGATTNQVPSWNGTNWVPVTPSGGGTWGSITGTLSSQTDLQNALNAKANLNGGNTFTGLQEISETVSSATVRATTTASNQPSVFTTRNNASSFTEIGNYGSTAPFTIFNNPTADTGFIYSSNARLTIGTFSAAPVIIGTNGAERLRVTDTGQVSVGTNSPLSSAKLQIDSTTQGFLVPRMTSAQRLAIVSPVAGLQVYDTNLNTTCKYNGSWWEFTICEFTTAVQTSTSTTHADITEFISPSLEAGLYNYCFNGIFQSTATGTGIGFRIVNGTSTITTCVIGWQVSQANDGTDKYFQYDQVGLATNITSASVTTANVDTPALGFGNFRISVAGTVSTQFRSESTTAVSIRPDSIVTIRKVCN